MKNSLFSIALILLSLPVLPQNRVGIGTKAPSAQLHTTGSVRFQGLTINPNQTRLLVSDPNGNLYYRSIYSLPGSDSNWLLKGNAGTSSLTDFLGTTDYMDLVFRTNNVERIRALANGNVGIGIADPTATLHINSNVERAQLSITGRTPNIAFYDGIDPLYYGRIGFATGPNDFAYGAKKGDFVIESGNANSSLIFTTNNDNINNYERMRINGIGYVGIGTANPSAQFHTTGSVRFQGLGSSPAQTRLLVSDVNGNIFYRDASTLPGGNNNWFLTGNAGTNTTTNFLGTTDNTDLVFRTNNVERIRTLANGNVGIGIANPTSLLHVNSTVNSAQINITGRTPTIVFYDGINPAFYGRIGFATGPNDFAIGTILGDFVIGSGNANSSLIFSTNNDNINNFERMRINGIGYAGISTQTPTAKLHVNCISVVGQTNPSNIRFQNLQSGSGNVLVIDGNGYVYRSNSTALKTNNTSSNQDFQKIQIELSDTKKELEILKDRVNELENKLNTNSVVKKEDKLPRLIGNYPNPTKGETTITYYLPPNTKAAYCRIISSNGKIVKTIPIDTFINNGNLQISDSVLQSLSGNFFYSLFVDDKLVDTKQLSLIK